MATHSDFGPTNPQGFNSGSWNQEESLKYLIFLDENKIIMSSKKKRNVYRVFDQMSEFLGTRNSLQCRSHHQKAIEKYKYVKEIIKFYKQTLEISNYRSQFRQAKVLSKLKPDFIPPKKLTCQAKKEEGPLIQSLRISNSVNIPPVTNNQPYSMFPMVHPTFLHMIQFFYPQLMQSYICDPRAQINHTPQ